MSSEEVKSQVPVDNDSATQSFRDDLASSSRVDEKAGTADDRANMLRMGKTQELRVGDPISLRWLLFIL